MELPEKRLFELYPVRVSVNRRGANLGGLAELSHDIVRFPVRIGMPPALPGRLGCAL